MLRLVPVLRQFAAVFPGIFARMFPGIFPGIFSFVFGTIFAGRIVAIIIFDGRFECIG